MKFKDLTIEEKEKARQVIEMFTAPMKDKEIMARLAKLQVICSEREKSEKDAKGRAIAYLEVLRKYPADVLRDCFEQRYKWFPALADLCEYCENKMAFRYLVKKGLRSCNTV